MEKRQKLVFGYAYVLEYGLDPNADYFGDLPRNIVPGYYVGFTTSNPGGSFRELEV